MFVDQRSVRTVRSFPGDPGNLSGFTPPAPHVDGAIRRRLARMAKHTGTAIAEFGPDLIGLVLPPVGMLVHGGVFAGRHALGRKKPPPVPPSSEHIREQLARTLSQRAAAGPVVAVIDDLHWADHASIELLFHLARTLSTSAEPLVIIGTYRPADARIARERFGSPLETMINELRRYSLCFYVDLDAIVDPVGSRSFVDAFLDQVPNRFTDEFRSTLFQRTGGHPLFLTEMVRSLEARKDIRPDSRRVFEFFGAGALNTLPGSVNALIDERLQRLDEPSRDALAVASVGCFCY